MSDDMVSLFDQLPAETSPRHLPVAGVAYKFIWTDEKYKNDWKADGYQWQNQGAAKKIMKYVDVLYCNVISLWFLLCVAFGLLIMYFYVIGAIVNDRKKGI